MIWLIAAARVRCEPAMTEKGGCSMTAYPVDLSVKPEVTAFFDPATNTISYVVKDPASPSCAIVDAVMDFDYSSGRTAFEHADAMIRFIEDNGLTLFSLIFSPVPSFPLSFFSSFPPSRSMLKAKNILSKTKQKARMPQSETRQ